MLKKPTLAELGEVLHDFSHVRKTIGFKPNLPPPPPYLQDLFGNIRSFAKHKPDGTVEGDSGTPARHCAAVVEDLHMQVRHYFQHVEPQSDLLNLPAEISETFHNACEAHRRFFAVVDPQRTQKMADKVKFDMNAAWECVFAHFNNFPEVSITLHEKGDFKKTRSITLPNTPLVISHPTSKDVKSPVPLSAALWSIYNGRKSLLGSAESPIMKDFIGLQESITKYMQSIREMIEAELARQGDDIGKYITLDYTSLAGVVAREEHHLKVGGLCEYLERGTESTAKLISWFKPGAAPVDIRTEQWAGRDVASLLYVLDHRLREDLRNHPLPQMRTMDSGSCFSSNLTEQNNQILSLCTRLYSLKPPSWQNVKDMITADSEAIKLLQDVWLLAKATNQIKGNDRFNPALNALESIIPQMRVLHKLPEIAAAFDLPGIDPGSKRVRG